jgi:hypothetical protein
MGYNRLDPACLKYLAKLYEAEIGKDIIITRPYLVIICDFHWKPITNIFADSRAFMLIFSLQELSFDALAMTSMIKINWLSMI